MTFSWKDVKRLHWDCRILFHYGTLYPQQADLPRCRRQIRIDPRDQRARKMLLYNPLRGRFPPNQRFWQHACHTLQPGVAIDVGANYGECLFGAVYPAETRVIGIEANPALISYLKESRDLHEQSEQIEIHQTLAGAESGRSVPFFLHNTWSGGSTAAGQLAGQSEATFQQIDVESRTVDDILGPLPPDETLPIIFKIDVEGYERQVLEGMPDLLDCDRPVVGLIEFDPSHLEAAGEDVAAFWNWLRDRFRVFWLTEETRAAEVTGWDFPQVCQRFGKRKMHTDLLLAGRRASETLTSFLDQWTGRASPDALLPTTGTQSSHRHTSGGEWTDTDDAA